MKHTHTSVQPRASINRLAELRALRTAGRGPAGEDMEDARDALVEALKAKGLKATDAVSSNAFHIDGEKYAIHGTEWVEGPGLGRGLRIQESDLKKWVTKAVAGIAKANKKASCACGDDMLAAELDAMYAQQMRLAELRQKWAGDAVAFWIDQFQQLNKALPKYDATKVRWFNKVRDHYRASGLTGRAAGTPAHWYNEYRAGTLSLQTAAKGLANEMGTPSLRAASQRVAAIMLAAELDAMYAQQMRLAELRQQRRLAAWKAPSNSAASAGLAKVVEWPWMPKSLGDLRQQIGAGVLKPMSMRDRIDNQDAVKKWTAGLSKNALHAIFRATEKKQNGTRNKQYTMSDEAWNKLK